MNMYLSFNNSKLSFVQHTEDYTPKELLDMIKAFIYSCIGGETISANIGTESHPNIFQVTRAIKASHWRKLYFDDKPITDATKCLPDFGPKNKVARETYMLVALKKFTNK